MIQVLFFAQLKELLGQGAFDVNIEAPCSVAQMKHALSEQNPNWSEQIAQSLILCAVNQVMVEDEHMINQGDEVAFFPPVTGG